MPAMPPAHARMLCEADADMVMVYLGLGFGLCLMLMGREHHAMVNITLRNVRSGIFFLFSFSPFEKGITPHESAIASQLFYLLPLLLIMLYHLLLLMI